MQGLLCAGARTAAETPAEPVAIPPRRQLQLEWESRLAAVAGQGAVRRVRGVVSGKELMVIVLRLEGQRETDMARQLGVRVGAVNMRLVGEVVPAVALAKARAEGAVAGFGPGEGWH